MSIGVHFERPEFCDVIAAMRSAFAVGSQVEMQLTPDSIAKALAHDGVALAWRPVPGWAGFECGRVDIPDEEFLRLLFSGCELSPDEQVVVITDECFDVSVRRAYSLRFGDLGRFIRDDYPSTLSCLMDFFQPRDVIFFAEGVKLLVMLHHEGYWA